VPKLGDYFAGSSFRARFENNSRFGKYLSLIPTYVISSKYPALIGAAVAIKQQYSHLGVSSVSH
jgi:glucokinase